MIKISNQVSIPDTNVQIQAIRSQGPGGQNVNKVASAVHIRFDIQASDLPRFYKERLIALNDHRITSQGIIVIKAQSFRSQEKNRVDGMERLVRLIQSAVKVPKKRKSTRPTRASKKRRLDAKARRGKLKTMRQKPSY